jgi:hypothetical protein
VKYKWVYSFDVFVVRVRKKLKLILPLTITQKISLSKTSNQRKRAVIQMVEDKVFPWMSPNIWMEIIGFYRKLENPSIFEFGTGASTLWHVDELIKKGSGRYIGVENDRTWFWLVVSCLLKRNRDFKVAPLIQIKYLNGENHPDCDVNLAFNGVQVLLHLRSNRDKYVKSFDVPCDVVIIDGDFRKQCVNQILQSNNLRPGGLLMLMEAGRGASDWWEGKLHEDRDYSSEVSKLMSLGGIFLDGNGVDNWAGCGQRSPRPISYYCPKEACKMLWNV